MHININELKNALSIVMPAVSSKPVFEALNHIRFKKTEDELILSATDYGVFIEHRLKLDGDPFDVCVLASELNSFISKLKDKDDEVEFIFEENKATVKKGKKKVSVPTLNSAGFPDKPKVEDIIVFFPEKDYAVDAFEKMKFFAQEPQKPLLTSIYFNPKSKQMTTTDGKTGGIFTFDEKRAEISEEAVEINMPATNILSAMRSLSKGESDFIEVLHTGNYVAIKSGLTTIATRIISGRYPDITKILPKEFKYIYEVDADELAQSIEQSKTVEDSEKKFVRLHFNGDSLKISSQSNRGEFNDELEASHIEGEEIVIYFNSSVLLNLLKTHKKSEISFNMNGAEKPVIVKGSIDNYENLIMPMKI